MYPEIKTISKTKTNKTMKRIIFTTENKETGKITSKEIIRDCEDNYIFDKEEFFATARENIFTKEIERDTIISDSTTKIEWESLTSYLSLEIVE